MPVISQARAVTVATHGLSFKLKSWPESPAFMSVVYAWPLPEAPQPSSIIYGQANWQTYTCMCLCNAVALVWGSLRFTPMNNQWTTFPWRKGKSRCHTNPPNVQDAFQQIADFISSKRVYFTFSAFLKGSSSFGFHLVRNILPRFLSAPFTCSSSTISE